MFHSCRNTVLHVIVPSSDIIQDIEPTKTFTSCNHLLCLSFLMFKYFFLHCKSKSMSPRTNFLVKPQGLLGEIRRCIDVLCDSLFTNQIKERTI